MTTSFSNHLSALVITHNEELNIFRTLSSLQWIPNVLIVDSGSSDQTITIAKLFSNTRIIQRKFDSFARQCNFGLEHLSTDWVISLDADYILSPRLSEEIKKIDPTQYGDNNFQAFSIEFIYCINGKSIQSGLLPARTCLYRRTHAKYVDIGHGHKVVINGRIGKLKNKILHDDRKPFKKWLENQQKYQKIEASMLASNTSKGLPIQDLIRKHTFLAPFLAFFMCLVLRRGFLDGKEGLIYAFHRLIAESLLYLYMQEQGGKHVDC